MASSSSYSSAFAPGGLDFSGGASSSGNIPTAPRPRLGSRALRAEEQQALLNDDFLLGRDLESSRACKPTAAEPATPPVLPCVEPSVVAAERLPVSTKTASAEEDFAVLSQAFAELDVALKCRDAAGAEVVWKELVKHFREASVVLRQLNEHAELRHVASDYVEALTPQVLDDLEAALDRGDCRSAEKEHQRLAELRLAACCASGTPFPAVHGAGAAPDASWMLPGQRSRKAHLEARYQQLVHRRGPLVCCGNAFGDLWCMYYPMLGALGLPTPSDRPLPKGMLMDMCMGNSNGRVTVES
eukprot:TRINITY_DN57724_c0_g1_i1.p1 TRINITY_DN57724_c0_g1~~TRINITY_DN57724_c0_g1_i1.p1  ORF type:complete len:300 (+),score=70.50 TRINITY_DN57724_c0_g1_i1:95-994(+)